MVNCQQLETQISELTNLFTKSIKELKTLINGNKREVINAFSTKLNNIEKQLEVNHTKILSSQ